MVYGIPTAYKAPSVYKTAGGGGVTPAPDPSLYIVGNAIRATGKTSFDFPNDDTHTNISITDKISFDIYMSNVTGGYYFGVFECGNNSVRYIRLDFQTAYWVLRTKNRGNDFSNTFSPAITNSIKGHQAGDISSVNSKTITTDTGSGQTFLKQFFSWGFGVGTNLFFSLKIEDENGTIKNNFIPVKRIEDGKIGFYDTYSDYFVQNSLDGTLELI